MEKEIRVVVIEPGTLPRVEVIENSLRSFQGVVNGLIEPMGWVFDDKPSVLVNEEGKITGELPNRAVYATAADEREELVSLMDGKPVKEGDLLDIVFGTMLCCGFDEETGEHTSISDEEIVRVRERFGAGTVGSGMKEVWRILSGGKEEMSTQAE